MRRLIALVILGGLVLIAGCAQKPTQQQIDSADYGYAITQYDAQKQVQDFFSMYLKDPSSAQYSFGDVYKGYYVGSAFEGRKLQPGYMLDVRVNAKNSFGGYVGAKPYRFLFRNAKMVSAWEITPSGMNMKIF